MSIYSGRHIDTNRVSRPRRWTPRLLVILLGLCVAAYLVPEGLSALQSGGLRTSIVEGADFPSDI